MSTGPRQEPEIVTFGCRLNAFESEVIRDCASDRGNAIIFNTCAVTAEAERQARQAIRKARRAHPGAEIIVTGCAAQVNAAAFAAMPEVDRVLGNAEKLRPESYISNMRVQVGDIMQAREVAGHLIEGFDGRARAFVQVQQGCDHRCTFCIIPFGRGNSRSVPIGEIVTQVRQLVENGYREIVLTGVDITSYGTDLPGRPALGQMARRLLQQVPELPRLRISSIDCIEIDSDLLRLIESEPRLMPHFHLSLQSGDDMILKRMKRRHSREDAVRFCEEARRLRPGIAFGADIIAGFPTETEAMFENALRLVADCGLTFLHVFPFSPRTGTPAARMPQLQGPVIRARAARLRAAGDAALATHLAACLDTTQTVLTEGPRLGRAEDFTEVAFAADQPEGTILTTRIAGREGARLLAA